MARLAAYKYWILVGLVVFVIGVLPPLFFFAGCDSTSTGTGPLP